MKQKRNYLLLFPLIAVFLTAVNFSSAAIQISVKNILDGVKVHQARLHSLYLTEGSDENTYDTPLVGLKTNGNHILVSNGLLVGKNNSIEGSSMVAIGGGVDNTIQNSENSGIAGGNGNKIIKGNNSVIGGGSSNTITGPDAVIAGGNSNKATTGGIVVGGSNNTAKNNGVVFGGLSNTAEGYNSLILGSGSKGGNGSFAWNGEAKDYSAYIGAKNGVLIGTYDTIAGVNLVVNGGIKLGGDEKTEGTGGEIRVVGGCFYAYDGEYWHVINQSGKSNCSGLPAADTCEFGAIQLQAGDRVFAYKDGISTDCSSIEVVCLENGDLVSVSSPNEKDYKYPYCYEL